MIMQILTKTPIWVWPLLIGLVALGLRASKERWMPAVMIYFMPLLGLLSINNMVALPNQILVWSVFVGFYIVGALAGLRWQAKWTLGKEGGRVQVAGEWLTMITILVVFLTSFLNGLFVAIAPDLVAVPAVYLGLTLIKGTISGIFIGRALFIWRFMNVDPKIA